MIDAKKKKHRWRWWLFLLMSPFLVFFVVATLLYIPPVQRFIVDKVTTEMSRALDLEVTVDKVRLAFPLDLAVHGVLVKNHDSTAASVGSLRLSVPLAPLFKGRVDVDGLEVFDAEINTGKGLSDLMIRGKLQQLSAHAKGIDLRQEIAHLDEVILRGASLFVALSDTAKVEEEEEPVSWKIVVPTIKVQSSDIRLSMPGDSMRVVYGTEFLKLANGNFDLQHGSFGFEELNTRGGHLTYATRTSWNDGLQGNSAYQENDSAVWPDYQPATENFDLNYVQLSNLSLGLEHCLFDERGNLYVNLTALSLLERSGFMLDNFSGNLSMVGDSLTFCQAKVLTPNSHLDFSIQMSLDSMLLGILPHHQLQIKGELGITDVKSIASGFLDSQLVRSLPGNPLHLDISSVVDSTGFQLDSLDLRWKGIGSLKVEGELIRPATENQLGKLDFDLRTYDFSFLNTYLSSLGVSDFTIPRMQLGGNLDFNGDNCAWNIRNTQGKGRLNSHGKFNMRTESYSFQLIAKQFALQSFMPQSGISNISTSISLKGRGFDPLKKSTAANLNFQLDSLILHNWQIGHCHVLGNLEKGLGQISFAVNNDLLEGEGTMTLDIDEKLKLSLRSDIPTVNLYKTMDVPHSLTLGSSFSLDAVSNKAFTDYGLSAKLQNLRFITDEKGIPVRDFFLDFKTSKDSTWLKTSSGDMRMACVVGGNIENLMSEVDCFVREVQRQIKVKRLTQEKLKEVFPTIDFHLFAGTSNPIFNLFKEMGYDFHSLAMNIGISPQLGAHGKLRVSEFSDQGNLLLDTLTIDLSHDSTGLVAEGWVKNYKKKNRTKFEANLKSYLFDKGAGAEIKIRNHEGIVGMDFGILAALEDEGIKVQLYPENPVLAFRDFTVNKDNYFYVGRDSLIRADIDLLAKDGTGLRVYSQPSDSLNDLTVSLNQLNLAGISGVFPFLPSLSGMLNSDVHIIDDGNEVSAMAVVDAQQLHVDEVALGRVGLEAIYLPKGGGDHHVNAFVSVEENEILTLGGVYCSTPQHEGFNGEIDLVDFPLEMVNGFLSGSEIAMKGKAVGNLSVKGSFVQPDLNGVLTFSDAHLYSDAYGLDFRLDSIPVEMKENKLVLTDYGLYSKQKNNPLLLNGILDMRDLSAVTMNFTMSAKNFELINARKDDNSLVYGKVYADFDGSMKGTLEDMSVRGTLSVLDRTNMTYVLKDSPLTVEDRLHDLVQFVDFEIPEQTENVEPVTIQNFNMTLSVNINDAALFHCNLSEDGSNSVDLEGGGNLTLRLTQQGDMRLTGRFTANSGEMRYSLPVIPLKTFKLVHGSYVDFTGDMLNPTLNIAAKERVKAVVTENDQPRSVAFDVGVSITQPLDRMGLEFTIEAPEDLAVQNQLAAMNKAERGKAAVGMLATGMYLTGESMNSAGSGFRASNALTAFLQSEIQNIAGSALKTIDVTIGMENTMNSSGATTTDYSFQFAKRFWGNRIAVIVGGKVSAGAEADNSAESFIDNIAVEYRLDKTASRYVRVFYDRSFQDPLEGQLTKAGAGLVLRRKSDKLGDLFIFRGSDSKRKKNAKKDR